MAIISQDSEVMMRPNSNAWNLHTAETMGTLDGALPFTIDPANAQGEVVFLDSIGIQDASQYDLMRDLANPTITGPLHWNSSEWEWLAFMIGSDVLTGASPYTHTMTWVRDNARTGITCAWRVDAGSGNYIFEIPNLKPTSMTLQNDGGHLGFSVTTLGDVVLTTADSTNGNTEFDAITYNGQNTPILYNNMRLRLNSQAGGALGSSDEITDATDVTLTITRPYDPMEDVVRSFTSALDARRRAEPIWTGEFVEILLQFNLKTANLTTHIDDINDNNEYKADINFSESVGGQAFTFDMELTRLKPFEPSMSISRSARVGFTHSMRAILAPSTPTGMTNANEIHVVLVNNVNLDYDVG